MDPDQQDNQDTTAKDLSTGETWRCKAVATPNTVANLAGQGIRRARLKAIWLSTAARWAGPALIAVLVLAVAGPGGPEKASAGSGGVGSNDEATNQDSCDGQLSRAEHLDPQSESLATNADHGCAVDSAELDPELKAYLHYLRSNNCDLAEREKLLDMKAVNGASRTELHSAGYSYSEIEASFKRVLAFLDR